MLHCSCCVFYAVEKKGREGGDSTLDATMLSEYSIVLTRTVNPIAFLHRSNFICAEKSAYWYFQGMKHVPIMKWNAGAVSYKKGSVVAAPHRGHIGGAQTWWLGFCTRRTRAAGRRHQYGSWTVAHRARISFHIGDYYTVFHYLNIWISIASEKGRYTAR